MSTSTTKCWSLDVNNPVPKVLENTPASNKLKYIIIISLTKNQITNLYKIYND